MDLFKKSHDGGKDSGVTGYWLIESKSLFSIVILHFSPGTRDAYHTHAFNAWTWWLWGEVYEHIRNVPGFKTWLPSFKPKFTPKGLFHKVEGGPKGAWALSFRGPWEPTWMEAKGADVYRLAHGRIPMPL